MVDAQFIEDLKGLKHVGRYTITRELGRGGMAVVYLGRDPYIQRQVAIKMARPSGDEERAMFFMEAQSAGRLNHPNMVAVYDAGVHGGFCYITMEYVEGEGLDNFCKKDRLLPTKQAVEIIFSISSALDYAHKKGVIHRDIKPSNILLDKNAVPKITDFGIARIKGRMTHRGLRGTPSYMAPEQLLGHEIRDNTDIFALGCVLYELLTGTQAFGGPDYKTIMRGIVHGQARPLRELTSGLPRILEEILKKALAKDPTERYQTCLDFAYDLRVAIRGFSGGEAPEDKPKKALDYIRHIPFFNDFKPKQLEQLYGAAIIDKFKKGAVIITEGEIDDTFYIILSGEARILRKGETIARIGVGECFGEMAYIGGQARVATVTAETDCLLMRISATLLDRAPGPIQLLFFKNFSKFLVKRFSMFFKTEGA